VISLTHDGDVFLLRVDDGENRFNRASIDEWHAALDEIGSVEGPLALVTTGAGRFYSNGLDLDWLLSEGADDRAFLSDVHRLLERILDFPAMTVAAVNGHAFAAGAMLATAHDVVIMRQDRGFWCLPEVDLGLPLTPAMYRVVAAHLPESTLRDALLTGRRFGGTEALQAGIAHYVASEDELLGVALQHAHALASKNRQVIVEHKRLLHPPPV
jgi:enoyl-CoA hydratase/carnithine racemase